MKTKLSIIIPCYNCEKTLREAVDSCYTQGLVETEFEVIMVDDGSADSTRSLMKNIEKEHSNIKLLFHEKNRGGGAARNTGINGAQGEIIYCLDSDNFFNPNSIKPLLSFLIENNLDGVAFYERRFFVGKNKKRYSSHFNTISERQIELLDILNGSNTLLDNFFYTKAAYKKTLGYPEHHGFDTQCFEIRFLSAGNTVGICPNSIFWHRQAGGQKSYFERVYESGEYSLNMYYIMEDIMHLLSPEARELILGYDIFGNTKLGEKNLFITLINNFKDKRVGLFNENYKTYVKQSGATSYLSTEGKSDVLVNAINAYRNSEYSNAIILFNYYLKEHGSSQIIYYNVLRCAVGASGISKNLIEKTALETSQSFNLKKQKIDLNPNILKRSLYKVYKLLK